MEVIFIQEVAGVAKRNQVRQVADGYALNFLLPRGLAVRATPEKLQALSQQVASEQKIKERELTQAQNLVNEFKGKVITILSPASSTGTLYAAVSPAAVTEAVWGQLKVKLLPSQIVVPPHVKTIGDHQVQINLYPEVKVNLSLQIKAK